MRMRVEQNILMEGGPDRIDPDKRRPLIMSFQEFYGLAAPKLQPSILGQIPERLYRSPDADRARGTGPATAYFAWRLAKPFPSPARRTRSGEGAQRLPKRCSKRRTVARIVCSPS